jgi:hypothetical protein
MNRTRSLALLSLIVVLLGCLLVVEWPGGAETELPSSTPEGSPALPPPNELRSKHDSSESGASVETHHPRADLLEFEEATTSE